MVWQFIEVFKKIGQDQIQDDDFADRLSHRYTVILLIIFCVLVGSTQFVGSPISCWAPAHFSGAMTSYTNAICWIANTYYVPTDETLPNPTEPRQYRINYYQWVPFILAFMAFLFYAPWAIWHVMSKPSNLDSKSIMKIIDKMDQSNTEAREKCVRTVCKLIDRAIDYQHYNWHDYTCMGKIRRIINRCCLYKRNHHYNILLYMFVKTLYLLNVCGQFFLLNAFMGPNFNLYGFHVIRDLWMNKDFWESPRFPRVTMCDFVIRTLGENNHRNTIQCTLPINLFNEKIFMFLWFWFVLVSGLTLYSFLVWINNFTTGSRSTFIRRYLRVNEQRNYHAPSSPYQFDTKLFDSFIFDYLKQDGVFLLRIVKKNTNDLVVGELISALWDNFKRYPKYSQINNNGNELSNKNNGNVDESLLNQHKEHELLNQKLNCETPTINGITNNYNVV